MPTRLTVLDKDREEFIIDVPDNHLVLNGDYEFVQPDVAQTILITTQSTQFNFKPHIPHPRDGLVHLTVSAASVYAVINTEPQSSVEYPNPNLIEATDPTDGQCLCGITCLGTELAFVKVYSL